MPDRNITAREQWLMLGGMIWMAVALVTIGGCRSAPKHEPAAAQSQVTPLPPVEAQPIQLVSSTQSYAAEALMHAAAQIPTEAIDTEPTHIEPPQAPKPLLNLTLFSAVEIGLQQNPDLIALRQSEGVGLGVLGVARTYPFNPYLQITATPLQQPAPGSPDVVYHYVLVMQVVQLAHQQRWREEIGMAALNSVRWNILQAELNNIAQTERLYFLALYQRGIRDLVLANAELNEQLLSVSEKQLQAGHVAGADVAIVRLDTRSTRAQAELAEANYQTALLDLRRQLNLPLDTPIAIADDLAAWQFAPATAERLLTAKCGGVMAAGGAAAPYDSAADLVAGRPDVLAARSDLAVARAATRLANASRVPDLNIGPYYQRTESGTTYWGFRTQNDIPVFNSGVPLLRQRQQEMRQRQAQWDQLFARARIEAAAAIDRYERARRLVEASPVAPAPLPDELRRLEDQFRAAEVDVVRVFTARTSLIQFRRAHLDLLNELAQAAANVTAATGVPADVLIQAAATAP
ncbi:MAG TPA: TolC family protein [Pirellulales bacterium]|jgi:cobalt-zinc-cadmium efflux system outer membrane protein|nr:TolC family protein [Pirellulales bacterium]